MICVGLTGLGTGGTDLGAQGTNRLTKRRFLRHHGHTQLAQFDAFKAGPDAGGHLRGVGEAGADAGFAGDDTGLTGCDAGVV